MIKVRIDNLGEIRAAFRRAPRLMSRELSRAIKESTIYIGREAVRQVTYGPNRAIDTGRLRASIQPSIQPFRGEVGPHVNYAIYVHEGTRYMPARPFLAAAVDKSERFVQNTFRDAVQRVLSDIGRSI